MPAISPKVIVNQLLNAVHESGGTGAYVSESVRTHPRKFLINYFGESYSVWVYIWTLTHGGRVSLPNEFRIQMTSVESPLEMNPDGITVLMGYHPDLEMFAGFDLRKHHTFTAGSPSVQIDISALNDALQNSLSFVTKDNDEIAIGVRPDQFLVYCINAEPLHIFGAEQEMTQILSRAASLEEIPEQTIEDLAVDRKTVVESVRKKSRDANFKKIVMSAYNNRCAITRMQLRLVDAAHILPVAADSSSDHVTNGVALSPTFHRAYDNCLIYFDQDCFVRLSNEKVSELREANLLGGLDTFSSFMDQKIHLPFDQSQRPRAEYIELANRHRRIPGYL